MKLSVALLTCDRYDVTYRTVTSLLEFNDISDLELFYADDASTDARLRPMVEANGFEPVFLNDGPRMGCTPMSDAMLSSITDRVGDGFVLYLQNDFECHRPIPLAALESWFDAPDTANVRLWHKKKFRRFLVERRWPVETHAGEQIAVGDRTGWHVQVARLGWLCEMVRGAVRERQFARRAARQPEVLGAMVNTVFNHIGDTRTPGGIYHSKTGYVR